MIDLVGKVARSGWLLPALFLALMGLGGRVAAEPWVITTPVTISGPYEQTGDVVILSGGSLAVMGVGEPGFRLTGNLIVLGTGEVHLESSVVQVMSTYHGQYAVVASDHAALTMDHCDYRVPSGVQHALVAAGDATVQLTDSDFAFVQLVATERGTLTAERLDGEFEVILQEPAHLELRDIPRDPGRGDLWVWPEFSAGSRAVYSPPLPGWVQSWRFPPADATGIAQTCLLERCQVKLWPLLVQPGSDLTLRDIAPRNWVVVGLHLPSAATFSGLVNGTTYVQHDLGLPDRRLFLDHASIDTWNLYPELSADVAVHDSVLGEVLASDDSRTFLERTTVDGSGGFFGARDHATVEAVLSRFTCDVQAAGEATMLLRRSQVMPYPGDPTGAWTRFSAYDDGRLLLDNTSATSHAAAGGSGLVAIAAFADPPLHAPAAGRSLELRGVAALFSPDRSLLPGRWAVEAADVGGGEVVELGGGRENALDGDLATWSDADPFAAWELRVVLTDARGRTLTARWPVAAAPRARARVHHGPPGIPDLSLRRSGAGRPSP